MWSLWVLLGSIAAVIAIYVACGDGLFASPYRLALQQDEARRAAEKHHSDKSEEDRRRAVDDAREQRAHRRLRQLGFLLIIIPAIAQVVVLASVSLLSR